MKNIFLLPFVTILLSGSAFGQTGSLTEVMKTMKQKADAMKDYKCVYESFTSDGKKTMAFIFAYHFMKPKKIRLRVLSEKYSGTIMIYNPSKVSDKIRVKAGNPALAFLQNLFYGEYFDLDDKMILDVRRFGMHESDWPHFIGEHMKYLIHGEGGFVREETIGDTPTRLYLLTSKDPEKTLGVKKEELWICKETGFPVKFIQYDKSGTVIRRSHFRDLEIDTGLEAKLFEDF